jgi:translation initiation factor 2D
METLRLSDDDDRGVEAAPRSAEDDEKEVQVRSQTNAPLSAGLPPLDVSAPGGMDAMFERCFMSALTRGLKDVDLPMRCELFYANLLLPSRPPDVTLDLKKSAFKKQQKLFAAFEKRKLIAVKRVHGQDNIVRVDRDHPAYLEFVRASGDAGAGAGTSASAEPGVAGATDAAAASGLRDEESGPRAALAKKPAAGGASAVVVVTHKYRASTSYRPIFGARAVGNKDRLYDERECAEALGEYCRVNDLFVDATDAEESGPRTANESNPRVGNEDDAIDKSSTAESTALSSRVVRLDTLLGKELFGKKEAEGPGSLLAARLVLPRLLKKLQKHVAVSVTRGAETSTVVLKRALRPIKVRVDRRGGRKHVTSVSGLEDFAVDPDAFASAAQKSFSAATSSARLPGNAETGVEISIQGNVLRELVHALRVEWGIPGKYIETEDKSK